MSSKPGFPFVDEAQRAVQADETEHVFVVPRVGGSFEARLDDRGELFPRGLDCLTGGMDCSKREGLEMRRTRKREAREA